MHESALIRDVVRQVERVVAGECATRAVLVDVWLGARSHFSADHFRDHFRVAAAGTTAAGAVVDVTLSADPADPRADGVVLLRVDVED
jgi:Zn finger protein HypA/HybF involved in hydrogenase expression